MDETWTDSALLPALLNAMTTALYGFNGVVKSFRTHLEIYEDDEARLSSLEYLTPVLKQCEEALHIIQDFVTEVPRYCGVLGVTKGVRCQAKNGQGGLCSQFI
jgi:hypothetical protein